MKVSVNKQPVELSDNSNIVDLLAQIQQESTNGIAIAVNNQVVRKDNWKEYQLSENDNILLIKATQGG